MLGSYSRSRFFIWPHLQLYSGPDPNVPKYLGVLILVKALAYSSIPHFPNPLFYSADKTPHFHTFQKYFMFDPKRHDYSTVIFFMSRECHISMKSQVRKK